MNAIGVPKTMDNWMCLVASVIKQWLNDGAPVEDYEDIEPYINVLKHYAPKTYYGSSRLLEAVKKSTL